MQQGVEGSYLEHARARAGEETGTLSARSVQTDTCMPKLRQPI
jgi:hypothetical protein